jgi:hypothetical protein
MNVGQSTKNSPRPVGASIEPSTNVNPPPIVDVEAKSVGTCLRRRTVVVVQLAYSNGASPDGFPRLKARPERSDDVGVEFKGVSRT